LLSPSGPSTGSNQALKPLVRGLLEGFRHHPYIFMLRHSPIGRDAVYPYTHQVELLFKLFPRKPLRVLVGDEIGLGKTIEAIEVLKYLQEVGEVRRALVLVPRVLVAQWESELRRFGIVPYRIERDTVGRLKDLGFPEGVYLASIDLVKKDTYRPTVLDVRWDAIVVDEAHRVGIVGGRKNLRYEFLEELIGRNPAVNVVLLSATPHRGRSDDYILRLKLVDPNLHAGEDELDSEEFYRAINRALVFRRTKLDVNEVYEKAPVFKSCDFVAYVVEASEEERRFHDLLVEFLRAKLMEYYRRVGERPKALGLLLVLVAKRASSSPVAAMKTFDKMLLKRTAKLRGKPEEGLREIERKADEIIDSLFTSFESYGVLSDEGKEEKSTPEDIDELVESMADYLTPLLSEREFDTLAELMELAKTVEQKDSRLGKVIECVKEHLSKGHRVVIFTEFKDTAEYVYEALTESLPPPHRDRVCLVTAAKVKPPKVLDSKKLTGGSETIEQVKDWLRQGIVDVIVSTDVASEGLNLQYANVVIHYEPTWSPIKIVQRIGRVWRVGQERDVYSYSVLLTVDSDLAVLQNLYGKLLSWLVAGVESRVVVGEELRISFLRRPSPAEEGVDVLSIPTGDWGYSEYKAILEYLSRGGRGLEQYIMEILALLNQLKQISRRVTSERGDRAVHVENVISRALGGLCRAQAGEALFRLLESLAGAFGCTTERRGGRVFVTCPQLGSMTVEGLADVYRIVERLVHGPDSGGRPVILASLPDGTDLRELHLFEVLVNVDGRPTYSEVVGISRLDLEPVRGTDLLNLIARAVSNVIGVADYFSLGDDTLYKSMEAKAKSLVSQQYKQYAVAPLEDYIRFVESRGLSREHRDWRPRQESITTRSVSARWVGSVIFLTPESRGGEPPPPIEVREVERRAMQFVMEFERLSGRVPRDVSEYEHYDIESYDPSTGEVRYIEVKGRWGPTLVVELTEPEFNYARKLGERYWLYIVYDIGSGRPKLVAVRDPANTVKWKTIVSRRYILEGGGG